MDDHERGDGRNLLGDLSGPPPISTGTYIDATEPQDLFYSINIQVSSGPGQTMLLGNRGSVAANPDMRTTELVNLLVKRCIKEYGDPWLSAHAEEVTQTAVVTHIALLPNDPTQIGRGAIR
ncbi:hypothetical protein AB0G83_07405 [Streptomyces klenkii]|uniref:hypothetical protein n=1 Tax=Streptomyces klenkii TaxID=1420899 RepID=UPI0033D5D5D3